MKHITSDLCTGCSLCAVSCTHHAITMQADPEGFLVPVVMENLCTNCGQCIQVCPVASRQKCKEAADPKEVLACQAKDQNLLIEATAGGLFPVLCQWILEQGGAVFGAAYDDEMYVVHREARTMAEVKAFNGSKYVQSDITDALIAVRRDLIDGKKVLFSGTPCQIDAVKRYCEDIAGESLYTMDVICYGVPSPKLFRAYLDTIEKKHEKRVTDFRFRDKHTNGWSHTTVITLQDADRTCSTIEEKNHTKIPYYKMFGYRDCFRKSCYQCQYNTMQRVSDITTGNFWGIENLSNTFDTRLGVSMVLLNTKQGKKLFDEIRGSLIYERRSVEEAIKANDALVVGSQYPKRRDAVYQCFQKHGFLKTSKKFYSADWLRNFRIKLSRIKRKMISKILHK